MATAAQKHIEPASETKTGHQDVVRKPSGKYHHGNLRPSLIAAAAELLAEKGLGELSLRAVARRAGVSQTAPYRHFQDREALLAAVAVDGFQMLLAEIERAIGPYKDDPEDMVVAIGGGYITFAIREPERFRLMFGRDLPNRQNFPEIQEATDALTQRIGSILNNPALGIGVWASMHGLAWLLVEGVVDLGEGGVGVIPSRAEIVLRSLLSHLVEA